MKIKKIKEIFNKIINEMNNKKISKLISFACESEKNNCLISNKIIIKYFICFSKAI